MSTPDGGSVFPTPPARREWVDRCEHSVMERCSKCDDAAMEEWRRDGRGLTIRDYFAAKALEGFMAHPKAPKIMSIDAPKLAADAYSMADAMLAERAKP